MLLYTAPEPVEGILRSEGRCSIFLAGSIEMGKAEEWQDRAIKELSSMPVAVFNPRRKDWDSSWEQRIDNPQFFEQVSWELSQLERCDIAFFYFQPGTMSPVTLMELGYVLGRDDYREVIVVCPEGFWRKGNVDIISTRIENGRIHGNGYTIVRQCASLDEGFETLVRVASSYCIGP